MPAAPPDVVGPHGARTTADGTVFGGFLAAAMTDALAVCHNVPLWAHCAA